MYVCMYVCMYVYKILSMYTHSVTHYIRFCMYSMCVCMYVYVCMFVYMYVCVCMYVYVWPFSLWGIALAPVLYSLVALRYFIPDGFAEVARPSGVVDDLSSNGCVCIYVCMYVWMDGWIR